MTKTNRNELNNKLATQATKQQHDKIQHLNNTKTKQTKQNTIPNYNINKQNIENIKRKQTKQTTNQIHTQ